MRRIKGCDCGLPEGKHTLLGCGPELPNTGHVRQGVGGGKSVAFCLTLEELDELVIRHVHRKLKAKPGVISIDYATNVEKCAVIAWHLPVQPKEEPK